MKNAYKRFEQHIFFFKFQVRGLGFNIICTSTGTIVFGLVQPFFKNGSIIKTSSSIGVGRAMGEVVELKRTWTEIESDLSGPFIFICTVYFTGNKHWSTFLFNVWRKLHLIQTLNKNEIRQDGFFYSAFACTCSRKIVLWFKNNFFLIFVCLKLHFI